MPPAPTGCNARSARSHGARPGRKPCVADRLLGVMAAARIEAAVARRASPESTTDRYGSRRSRRPEQARRTCQRSRAHASTALQRAAPHLAHQILCLGTEYPCARDEHGVRIARELLATDGHAARMTRRARFRWTAPPTYVPAIAANRPVPGSEEHHDATAVDRRDHRRAPARDLARRTVTRFPQVRRSIGRGPCVGAPRGSRARHGCASGDGTRAPSPGGGCSVGTSVCLWP